MKGRYRTAYVKKCKKDVYLFVVNEMSLLYMVLMMNRREAKALFSFFEVRPSISLKPPYIFLGVPHPPYEHFHCAIAKEGGQVLLEMGRRPPQPHRHGEQVYMTIFLILCSTYQLLKLVKGLNCDDIALRSKKCRP